MNTQQVVEFSETRLCREEAQARYRLVERMECFVRNGLLDYDSRAKVDTSPLMGAVAMRFADTLSNGWSNSKMTVEQAQTNAQAAFEALFIELAQRFGCETPAPDLMGWAPPTSGESPEERSDESGQEENAASVQDALRIARRNRQRMQARVLVLYCLGALVPRLSESSMQATAAAQAYNQASDFLWRQVQRFDKDVMMFSILVGGGALQTCRQEILRGNLSRGHSVVHYLTEDGRIPSRWLCNTEEKFFSSLDALQG